MGSKSKGMTKLILTIPGIPRPKQSARFSIRSGKNGNNFIHKYQKKEIIENENNIRTTVLSQIPQGFQLFNGPVKINKLHYIFPPLKSMKKSEKTFLQNGGIIYKHTKPDLTDNLQKGLFDALEGILFYNDSQVCIMNNVKKYYGLTPMIILEIEEMNEGNDLFSE